MWHCAYTLWRGDYYNMFQESGHRADFKRTVDKLIPKELRRPITTAANRAMNHWEFLAITCSLFKAREKSRVQGAISFSFASHVSFSHQRWTNRLTICAAYVNSGRTLFDLFVWMDKSSSKDRLQEVDKQREKFRRFVRPKTYSSLFHTTCPSRRFVRL